MSNLSHMRHLFLLAIFFVSLALPVQAIPSGAGQGQQSEQYTVNAPDALNNRSNSQLKKKSSPSTSEPVEKKTSNSTNANKAPKRDYTTSQSISGRGMGFRIQAFSENSGANAKARVNERARAIAMKFPQYRTYISYNAPAWKLRVGDFQDQAEAQAALSRLRSAFPQFSREFVLVRDKVNVWSK